MSSPNPAYIENQRSQRSQFSRQNSKVVVQSPRSNLVQPESGLLHLTSPVRLTPRRSSFGEDDASSISTNSGVLSTRRKYRGFIASPTEISSPVINIPAEVQSKIRQMKATTFTDIEMEEYSPISVASAGERFR